MAEKISPETVRAMREAKQPKVAPSHLDAAEEMAMLLPDQSVVIGDETIIVREFRALEGMKARALARPFLIEIRDLVLRESTPPSVDALAHVIASHADIWVELIASVCGRNYPERRSVEWVAGLSNTDFAKLEEAFWRANGFFFIRRLLIEAATEAAATNLVRSRTSSSISPVPGSDGINGTSSSVSPGDKSSTTLN